MMEMREVYSSSVSEIGYDPATQQLAVKWAKGNRTSVYDGVPPEIATRIMNAPSIGQALREGIQDVYTHRYV